MGQKQRRAAARNADGAFMFMSAEQNNPKIISAKVRSYPSYS